MDLTIAATVTVLETPADMLEVIDTLVSASKGWFGGVTCVLNSGTPTPVWELRAYRTGHTDVIVSIGAVIVTDTTFVSVYSTVDDYNTAHPDNPIAES
ncbi:hypothetical protein B1R94_25915 [Mycolicibacterium litorale]|nr:hypothetical protein B1R94_25915 [Mycolicibacterium litorale]